MRAVALGLPIEAAGQPFNVSRRRTDQAQVPGLEGDDFQRHEGRGRAVDLGKIHRDEVAAELAISLDPLVIVQEIPASIENEAIAVDFDRLGVMR